MFVVDAEFVAVIDAVDVCVGVIVETLEGVELIVEGRELLGDVDGVPDGLAPEDNVHDGDGVLLLDEEHCTGSYTTVDTFSSP